MNAQPAPRNAPRSTFVNVLAWIFIGLSSFSVLMSILQNVMMHVLFRGPEFERMMQAAGDEPRTPAFALFMFDYLYVFMALALLLAIATLVASIGLLRRRNWARLLFVGLMALGIVWNIGGFLVQLWMFPSMPDMGGDMPDEFEGNFQLMFVAIMVFGGFMALGFSVLFGWIIKRLLSPPIVAEFLAIPRPA
jgi:hypothetical protein